MKFSYAIFDMDGLMFDTERLFIRGFAEMLGPKLGYTFPETAIRQLIGINQQAALEAFPALFPGCPQSGNACFAAIRAWINGYVRENGIPVKPGLRELLAWLKKEGVPCAVATSSDRSVAAFYLESAGITDCFAAIVGGDQVTRSKPDPEIFNLAMRALGGSEPGQCVVFEDSRNGLLAGANGGFSVIVVPDVMDPTIDLPGKCYAKCARLDEAVGVLQNA